MPLPYDPGRPVSRAEAVTNMLKIAEVADRHKVPLRYHTGIPMGYTAAYSYGFLGRRTATRYGDTTSPRRFRTSC